MNHSLLKALYLASFLMYVLSIFVPYIFESLKYLIFSYPYNFRLRQDLILSWFLVVATYSYLIYRYLIDYQKKVLDTKDSFLYSNYLIFTALIVSTINHPDDWFGGLAFVVQAVVLYIIYFFISVFTVICTTKNPYEKIRAFLFPIVIVSLPIILLFGTLG